MWQLRASRACLPYTLCFSSPYRNSLLQKLIWEMDSEFHTQRCLTLSRCWRETDWDILTSFTQLWVVSCVKSWEMSHVTHVCERGSQLAGRTGWNINYWCLETGIWKATNNREYTEPAILAWSWSEECLDYTGFGEGISPSGESLKYHGHFFLQC